MSDTSEHNEKRVLLDPEEFSDAELLKQTTFI